jgi:PhnB protein
MKLDIYINYPGHREEAFRLYEEHLGGKINLLSHYQQLHLHFPKEWKAPVLHAAMEIGGTTIRGADVPGAQPMPSAYLTLRLATSERAEEVYSLLAADGEIFMKMEKRPSPTALRCCATNLARPGCCLMRGMPYIMRSRLELTIIT